MPNTTWVEYPFEVDGVSFVSKVDTTGTIYKQIRLLPEGIFAQMNKECVREIIGNPSKFTRDELESELSRVNLGGTQAFIVLA